MMKFIALGVSLLLIAVDQLVKWLVTSNMNLHDSIPIWKIGDTEILNFSYYLNDGAAFSILEGKRWFLILITTAALIFGVILLLTKKITKPRYIWAVSVIIAGGVGNLIDRIFNDGMVVDFIDFRFINFAIFNVADMFATGGAIALLVFVIFDEINEAKNKKMLSMKTVAEINGEENTDETTSV